MSKYNKHYNPTHRLFPRERVPSVVVKGLEHVRDIGEFLLPVVKNVLLFEPEI